MIEKFMDFINSYSMDKKRYWVLKDVYDVKKFGGFLPQITNGLLK